MMHIILLDSLDKLAIKKDSSLLLAMTLQLQGYNVRLLFEEDFYYQNRGDIYFKLYNFSGRFQKGSFYIESFDLDGFERYCLRDQDIIHMRLEPPFDGRYLRILWMLQALKVRVINSPRGLLLNNEKLTAYRDDSALPSYVGGVGEALVTFIEKLKSKYKDVVIKPLDMFQGRGVEKVALNDDSALSLAFKSLCTQGPFIVQPFDERVLQGETRAIFYNGNELGSILKIPAEGNFLSNVAAGASCSACDLSVTQLKSCQHIAQSLLADGIEWIAFDLIGDNISEVNVTCPGLLVECSNLCGKNLAEQIIAHYPK